MPRFFPFALNRRQALLGLGAAAFAGPVLAQAPRRITPEQQADVERVETYLNQLRTLRARFLQIDSRGATAEGTFFLSRPGKLRLDYDAPNPNLLISNGSFLIHFDRALKTPAYLPLDSTPAGLLVRENIKLSGDVTVTRVERGPAVLRVSMVQSKDPRAGEVTFVFSDRPFGLINWQVTDGQGQQTRVQLSEAQTGLSLDPQLFVFRDAATFPDNPTR